MPKPITLEMLEKMTIKERLNIYEQARKINSPEADNVIELLFQHKLIDSAGGGLPRHHMIIQSVERVCRSPDAICEAVKAAQSGEAPMAGVDPMLVREIREYGHFDTTSWAGSFVAEEIEALDWIRSGRKALPAKCVARTAAFFKQPESK